MFRRRRQYRLFTKSLQLTTYSLSGFIPNSDLCHDNNIYLILIIQFDNHSTKLLQTLPEKHIMRKSYEVGISPKINLCNSVEVLTNSFGTVISGRQV
ncbi:hypothetical protein DMH88_02155 [Escherichia coli]|nr:hypothetical protein [Escherichia coli]